MKRKYLKWALIAVAGLLLSVIVFVVAMASLGLGGFGYVDQSVEIELIAPGK